MKFSYYQHKNIVSTLQTIQKTVKMNSALLYTFYKSNFINNVYYLTKFSITFSQSLISTRQSNDSANFMASAARESSFSRALLKIFDYRLYIIYIINHIAIFPCGNPFRRPHNQNKQWTEPPSQPFQV